jgi:hypothetical protein
MENVAWFLALSAGFFVTLVWLCVLAVLAYKTMAYIIEKIEDWL